MLVDKYTTGGYEIDTGGSNNVEYIQRWMGIKIMNGCLFFVEGVGIFSFRAGAVDGVRGLPLKRESFLILKRRIQIGKSIIWSR